MSIFIFLSHILKNKIGDCKMENVTKVRYNNKLNDLENGTLSAVEQNLFFYICARAREHGENIIEISFDSIRERTEFSACGDASLIQALKKTNENIFKMPYEYVTDDNVIIQGGLFSEFTIDPHKRTLSIKINKDLLFLLNNLNSNFDEWILDEFVDIKSVYSKRIYRICKQWRSVGRTPIYKVDDFRKRLAIPNSYPNKLLIPRILEPAHKDLSKYFHDFQIKIHKGSGKGSPITGISFYFSPILYLKSD